jgi:hypothetical protein
LPADSKINKLVSNRYDSHVIALGLSPVVYFFDLDVIPDNQPFKIPDHCSAVIEAYLVIGPLFFFLGDDNTVYGISLKEGLRLVLRKTLHDQRIVSFSVDNGGRLLILIGESGDTLLYNLHTLLAWEESEAVKKIERGTPYDLVYQSLKPATIE